MAFLPSEIARLVLGYLKEVSCTKTHQTFMQECSHLSEYAQFYAKGREYPTNIGNKSLLDILNRDPESNNSSNLSSSTLHVQPIPTLTHNQAAQTLLDVCDKEVQTHTLTTDESIQTAENLMQADNSKSSGEMFHINDVEALLGNHDPALSLPFCEEADHASENNHENHIGSHLSNDLFGDPSSVLSLESISGTDDTPWSTSQFSSPDHNRNLLSESESLNTPNVAAMTPGSLRKRRSPWNASLTPKTCNNPHSVRRNLLNEMATNARQNASQDLENARPQKTIPEGRSSRAKKSSIYAKPAPKRTCNNPVPIAKRPAPRKQLSIPEDVLREAKQNLPLSKNSMHSKRNLQSINAKIRNSGVNSNKAHISDSAEGNILVRAMDETQLPYQVYYSADSGFIAGSSTLDVSSAPLTLIDQSILMNSSGVTICSSSELDQNQRSASDVVEIDARLLESVNVEDFLQTHVHDSLKQ